MHKTLMILALFSVGSAHVAAGESDALRLFPLTHPLLKSEEMATCTFQLKGTKDPKIEHFAQFGVCLPHVADLKDCNAVSVININNSQLILRNISPWGLIESARYKNDDYVVEMKAEQRVCKKVSCTPFELEALLTVKKGSLQQTFGMQGYCYYGEN